MSEVRDKPAASTEAQLDKTQGLKLLVELGPLVLFFLVNWQAGKHLSDPKQAIFWATGSFMAATVAALCASKYLFGKVAVMPLVTGVFVMVFGGLTIYLQDEQFIKMKPTIVNAIFSALLFVGLVMNRMFLKMVFGDVMRLTEPVMAQVDGALGRVFWIPRPLERDRLEVLFDRYLGNVQGLWYYATHDDLRDGSDWTFEEIRRTPKSLVCVNTVCILTILIFLSRQWSQIAALVRKFLRINLQLRRRSPQN